MYKNELRANPTLINCVIMLYELKEGITETHKSIGSLKIQFWSWFNIPLKRHNYTPVPNLNNNEMKIGLMTYYPLHADSS